MVSYQEATSLVCKVFVAGVIIFGCRKVYKWKFQTKSIMEANPRAVTKRKFPKWAVKRGLDVEPPSKTPKELESLNQRKPPEIWNTGLFFPDANPRSPDSSIKRLKNFLKEAKTSIYICMYLCSNLDLSDVIKNKYREGLIVQILSDYDTWTAHNSIGFKSLAEIGIEVRLQANGYLMHNKFVIIDEEAVLTGSLNWTKQAVTANYENVLVSTDPAIVSKFINEYFNIWKQCRPYDHLPPAP